MPVSRRESSSFAEGRTIHRGVDEVLPLECRSKSSARDCPNIDIAHGGPPHQVTQTGLVGNALPAVSVDIYNIFRTPKVLSFLLGQIGTSNALVESTAKEGFWLVRLIRS